MLPMSAEVHEKRLSDRIFVIISNSGFSFPRCSVMWNPFRVHGSKSAELSSSVTAASVNRVHRSDAGQTHERAEGKIDA